MVGRALIANGRGRHHHLSHTNGVIQNAASTTSDEFSATQGDQLLHEGGRHRRAHPSMGYGQAPSVDFYLKHRIGTYF
jgi:hypothetical protein